MEQIINSKQIKELFSKSGDVLIRPIKLNQNSITLHLFCVDGLINSQLVDEAILTELISDDNLKDLSTERQVMDYLLSGGSYHVFTKEEGDYQLLLKYVLSGMVAFIFDGEQKAIVYDIRMFDKRSISEPNEEMVLKGAKDAFIEVMRVNTALIRRRIRSEYLVVESLSVGRVSKTDMSLVYMSNIANMDTVNKIRDIIKKIDIDNISTPAFIEEYLIENKKSLFPQIMYSQRPDRISANLSDGRIALVVDGIPFVYLLPCQLVMLMQSPEDYANHFIVGSSLRMIRYIAMIITLFLPAFYIAATTYQNQMLPVQLALSTQAAKQNVPFSSATEVLGLLIAFEILIEAGLRLPKTVGTAMSILGGLVVGQSAVTANILSPLVVVIVSLAGIAGFIMPNQDLSSGIRVIRFTFSLLAALAGFFGLAIGLILLFTHLCSLDNYGVAYLSPFVDIDESNHKDTLFRYPIRYFTKRPQKIASENRIKQNDREKIAKYEN
ncbi:spore germination protein [Lachnospiraceae bacterium MD1]|jgi:spore germination protein KA|uniref:Spore germination protein n=1 Tax=Variimorphobacter saccharofermentans TaxID=2755051 RepID=A0A839K0D1_9FIRM|nr:spore germination protein [Variimorphobacter saccharofermentans]MBB2183144.1 spore germination protein [Variimorphobacter saccharofermentans]